VVVVAGSSSEYAPTPDEAPIREDHPPHARQSVRGRFGDRISEIRDRPTANGIRLTATAVLDGWEPGDGAGLPGREGRGAGALAPGPKGRARWSLQRMLGRCPEGPRRSGDVPDDGLPAYRGRAYRLACRRAGQAGGSGTSLVAILGYWRGDGYATLRCKIARAVSRSCTSSNWSSWTVGGLPGQREGVDRLGGG
jgi:hypothetical protein